MKKLGTYYLGRINKVGTLTTEKIITALSHPVSVSKGQYEWTITDFQEFNLNTESHFIFGKLSKFSAEGTVDIIDKNNHTEISKTQPDLKKASSPFIYIPKFQGIAYLHVWNDIDQKTFIDRFAQVVEEKYDRFFVKCVIEAVSDLKKFYQKLILLEKIESIQASVKPPNPLFGRFWKNLKEYLERRNTSEMKIEEKSTGVVNSNLRKLVEVVVSENNTVIDSVEVDIGDEAVLMATDGYGKAKIEGETNGKKTTLRTRDTIKNFNFSKSGEPEDLFKVANELFEEINKERHMEH